jgi:glycosyltransferase involved in cell wall biosynthesis
VQFTTKPNIYGSIAAGLLGIPAINNVSGLGAAFDEKYGVRTIVRILYRLSFRYARHTFFLNHEDLSLFVDQHLVDSRKVRLIPGAGVDVEKYRPRPRSTAVRGLVFLMLSRLIWEKGISDYLQAAKILRQRYGEVEFQLLGFPVENIRDGLTLEFVATHLESGAVNYLGGTDNVVEYIRNADCIVLPTRYREGVPRSLLEAASMAKPIIASDNVGCREIVDHGENGFLFRHGPDSLVEAMEQFISLSAEARREMGMRGRDKVMREFNIERVIDTYIKTIEASLR